MTSTSTRVLWWLLRLIGATTVVSGGVQMLAPQVVLEAVGGDASPAALHFFAIVGMFMVLFGALLWFALEHGQGRYPLVLAGLQKFGASAAVALGISKGFFGAVAALVAGFDFLSAVLIVVFLVVTRRES
jgi:hypothetical protein